MRRTRRPLSPYIPLLAALSLHVSCVSSPAHGDVHQAIATLTRELDAKPDSPALLFERASLYSQYEHWTEAIADLDRLLTLQPEHIMQPALRASVLRRSGRPAEARLLQEAFLKAHPGHSQVTWDYCQTLAALNETAAALRELDTMMRKDAHPAPDAIALRLRIAEAADAAAALTWLDGFLATHPLPVFQEEALRLELKLGRQSAALQRMDKMIAVAPRPEFMLLRKAELLSASGDREAAAAAARSAQAAITKLPAHVRSTKVTAELESKAAQYLSPRP